LENTRLWRAGGDRRAAIFPILASPVYRTCRQSPGMLASGGDLFVEGGDGGADRFQMSGKNLPSLGDFWKRRIAPGLFDPFV
ncbi:MAG: hypothetical protein M3178_17025, partial [Pseudomonadota bacterium]|nr:hypothetical protein [Pseudomonadota bacterium]